LRLRVWRLAKRRYARVAFDGTGGRENGGRWNHPGVAVVYTAGSLSLAALELFVHVEAEDAPLDLVAILADVPDDVSRRVVRASSLPRAWRTFPAPPALPRLGTEWALRRRTCVLAVPSAIVPGERNYLLNPAHPDFGRIRIGRPEPFRFDPRMWK
jgi:RES domain-containing protein